MSEKKKAKIFALENYKIEENLNTYRSVKWKMKINLKSKFKHVNVLF